MADLGDRPYSKDYSGLINQAILGGCILGVAITWHEFNKRKRRGALRGPGLGSVESWQFGYLYQGRSWAKHPSPPSPQGWPLSWVPQVFSFPMDKFNELRGVDAAMYCRFLRGCWWFMLSQLTTTFPILFPIHVHFSPSSVAELSMTRASITSLVESPAGLSLLWIHICLLFWITFCWIATLVWVARGTFRFRAANIDFLAKRMSCQREAEMDSQYAPHPHPNHAFHSVLEIDPDSTNKGMRVRTIMVQNLPAELRSEKVLREYFDYYLSRPLTAPAIGINTTTQPGIINKLVSFVFKQAKHVPQYLPHRQGGLAPTSDEQKEEGASVVDRVVVCRRLTELASLLERREYVLVKLESTHVKLARKALIHTKMAMEKKGKGESRALLGRPADAGDAERGAASEDHTETLIQILGPYVKEFRVDEDMAHSQRHTRRGMKNRLVRASRIGGKNLENEQGGYETDSDSPTTEMHAPKAHGAQRETIWEALYKLPRGALDPFQPLVHLSSVFRGKTVPMIDYYTTKLSVLTSLITEQRSRPAQSFPALSTAFVTFKDPADARRACKSLAVHPEDPLACIVTMAPQYEDLDWSRVMKFTTRAEFMKDWAVDVGVWAFTIVWLFPVSFIVGLVSINGIASHFPALAKFFAKHTDMEDTLQSFIPTLCISVLQLLVPLLLLLIAKKAHTFSTFSVLHDKILTRYYKFLVINVLIFFCVGTTAVQSILTATQTPNGVIDAIASSFPSAGPFYVGWLLFTTAMHGGLEIPLFGLPLILYPGTKRQTTPRRRAIGIRPRTFNYYYWLPNHVFVCMVIQVFAVLNPLVIPFAFIYYSSEAVVIKNQLLHVYAKNYEGNGQTLLVRITRYSLDGLMLSQIVFMIYMIFLKKTANIALSVLLFIITAVAKMVLTRMIRTKFEEANILEASIVCNADTDDDFVPVSADGSAGNTVDRASLIATVGDLFSNTRTLRFWSWRFAPGEEFSWNNTRQKRVTDHRPIPFHTEQDNFARLRSFEMVSAPGAGATTESNSQRSMSALPRITPQPPCEAPAFKLPPRPPLVAPHAKHPKWDDTPSLDRTYENPYYTRPIRDFLWLPRNPTGLLDLDDTVDLNKALTSEPSAGELGVWYEGAESSVPPRLATVASQASVVEEARSYHGDEDIILPAGIASRVDKLEEEESEPESVSPPRPKARRNSSARASSIRSGRPAIEHRTSAFSARLRQNSMASTTSPPRPAAMSPRVSAFGAASATGTAITAREAVVGEVLAEEEQAAVEQAEEAEEEQAESEKRARRWWSPWFA